LALAKAAFVLKTAQKKKKLSNKQSSKAETQFQATSKCTATRPNSQIRPTNKTQKSPACNSQHLQ
jgi:hypothetical protein